jgi:hypothetical protein
MAIALDAYTRYMNDAEFHARVHLVKQTLLELDCPEDQIDNHVYSVIVALHMQDTGLLELVPGT